MTLYDDQTITMLETKANLLRRHIIKMTFAAQSGHPGGSLSYADIITALFFKVLKHRPNEPLWEDRDKFVLSKGHAAPVYYAALAEAGYFPVEDLLSLRKLGSHLQGHPCRMKTPGVEISTGSLGQGLSVANGMALASKLDRRLSRIFCLMGDGELQEGQNWEAAMLASHYKLDNITAFVDRNKMQIDGPTEQIMSLEPLGDKWRAFGWNVIEINGHDMRQILDGCEKATQVTGKPTMVIAHTIKGKGVSFMEGAVAFHGKAPNADEYRIALKELGGENMKWVYTSQRKEYANALVEIGKVRTDVVVLDADLSSSTRTVEFAKKFPERFFNVGMAEQNMMGTAAGLAVSGKTVFASTFAVFATGRCWDQIRQSIAYPNVNVKIVATHAGITVGGDGASHQALEDIALMRTLPNMCVLVPADGIEAYKAVKAAADHKGPCYVRLGRADVPMVTTMDSPFTIGKATVLRGGQDVTLVGCGQMVSVCMDAAEELGKKGISAEVINMSTVKPLDRETLLGSVRKTGCVVTAEEHSVKSGLGCAVSSVLAENHPAPVRRIGTPDCFGESGESDELMSRYGLTAKQIVTSAEEVIGRKKA